MTQKEKELLLKDLCARLPYRTMVKCNTDYRHEFDEELSEIHITNFYQFEIKPYLRPMSSMTEEEKEEYINIKQGECNGCVLTGKGDPNTEFLLVDFFNTHHFDYRGLIEKGLALEAPENMYK